MERGEKLKILLVVALVTVITFFYYSTELNQHARHLFYQGLYFLPIMLAGFWLGLRGALTTSLSITALNLPFTFIYWKGFSMGDFNNVMEMVLYNAVALVLGVLRNREQANQKRLREVEELALMGKACSALAHDLRTPLIAIGGLSRLIQNDLKENDKHDEKLKLIVEEAHRLDNMVKEMLDFSRPLELRRSKEDVNQTLSQCFEIVSDLAQKRKVAVQLKSADNLPLVSFDPKRMKQVFINLLINAIEASPEGETVTAHSHYGRRKIIIDVTDQGDGIPIDKREEIFIPFFTTKEGGTGLGLPIVKKIVEAHLGQLELIENPGKGITFRVTIPIQ